MESGLDGPEASSPASYELGNFDCILNLPGAPFTGVVQKLEAKSRSHADLGLESQVYLSRYMSCQLISLESSFLLCKMGAILLSVQGAIRITWKNVYKASVSVNDSTLLYTLILLLPFPA